MARHDALLEGAVAAHGGEVVRPRGEGDSRFAVFANPVHAVAAALAVQRCLQDEDWQVDPPLSVRIAVHTGAADLRHGDYYGSSVNRCARLRSLGHPGQILLSNRTADEVRGALPVGATLVDLGIHRLKDLAMPERVFQLDHPDLIQHDFGPLRGDAVANNNLPSPVNTFVGREREVASLTEALQGSRLVTLTGPGGAGKTRLSIEVARSLVHAFPDGVWFVPLAPVTDGRLLPSAVATAVSPPTQDCEAEADSVVELFANRRALLVLDNCEHLLEAVAELCGNLLQVCPGMHIVATSQEALRVPGEALSVVPPLSTPDPGVTLEAAGTAALRLFTDRAKEVSPSFELTEGNLADVAEICRRLDGIPLAIELAAVRVRLLSPHQINERLADRFRLLTGGRRGMTPRQRTLLAAMDWSYELLSGEEKELLHELSVFRGSFDIDAAEAVGGGDGLDVLDLAAGLVEKSLVVVDLDHTEETTRYRLLETIREYAAEKLERAGRGEIARRRHREWFLDLTEWAAAEVLEGRTRNVLARLEKDQHNFKAAMEWSLANGEDETALRLASTLWLFWDLGGHLAQHWMTTGDDRAMAAGDYELVSTDVAPETLLELAEVQQLAGSLDRAWALADRARAAGAGDAALRRLAAIRITQGHFDQAAALLDAAETGETDPSLLLERGRVLLGTSDFEQAIETFQQGLRVVEPLSGIEGHLLLRLAVAEEWACTGLTDIHDQGRSPGKDVHHGDHGEEEATAPSFVHPGVQGRHRRPVPQR